MKKAALYLRVSTIDQNPENQLQGLRQLAEQRGFEIVQEFTDHGYSGARVKRPGLDQLLSAARRGQFEAVLIWACDRLARSTTHFLQLLDEFSRLNIELISVHENLDTGGALGRAIVIILAAISELERNLIRERVKAGMRRAQLEGRRIGRRPIAVDQTAILRDRACGRSLTEMAKSHHISRALVSKILRQAGSHEGSPRPALKTSDNTKSETAA
ncbi:MAG TPA: recombinase family protein [Candidatus Acidoferrales bacterium]|nr:recombinase family protein [Candidatus Acidoferrales bacterium]